MRNFTPSLLFLSIITGSLVFANAAFAQSAGQVEPTRPPGEAAPAESVEVSKPLSPVALENEFEDPADPEIVPTPDEKNKDSKDGSYEYHRYYGFGFELGYWFNYLERMGPYVYDANGFRKPEFNNEKAFHDNQGQFNLDLFIETSFLEGTRLSLFGGIQSTIYSEPYSLVAYGGIEPAFAFRREDWEVAVGIGVGFGGIMMDTDRIENGEFGATNFVLRPFFEVRHYFTSFMALYGRVGFNQWLITNTTGLVPKDIGTAKYPTSGYRDPDNLNEGGFYLSIGMRFGDYPAQTSVIGDRDGDGYKDDVDDCPDEPEDFDKFEDADGCPDPDNDKDGILDVDDQCPNVPEDVDGFEDQDGCPDPDNDKDGILDLNDQCPNVPEDIDGFEDQDGCPDPDNDKDGILDVNDQCPNVPEDIDGLADEDGCPEEDFDGDTVLDVNDKCPREPGAVDNEGCPFGNVRVRLNEIIILEKIYFAFDRATIKRKSYPLLNDIAKTLETFPRIRKVEIGGHTDFHGTEKYNLRLSQQRADAVLKYLLKKGIDPERLTAVGYGESRPLVPMPPDGKETKEGADKNRRVEFKILEQENVVKTIREDEAKSLQEKGAVIIDSSSD